MNQLKGQITLQSLVKVLAYCQYYTTPYLSGRGLPAQHLQQLTHWLGTPNNTIKTLSQHRYLAAHIVLLQAADLLHHQNHHWICSASVEQWLQQPTSSQYQQLINAIDRCSWTAIVQQERLTACFDGAYSAFVRQSLYKQQINNSPQPCQPIIWLNCTDTEWLFAIPANLPPKSTYYLLQFGKWNCQQNLQITPITIAQARQRGYNLNLIEYHLVHASQQSLTPHQQQQLLTWYLAANHYQIQAVYLLSTAQPHQLAAISQNRRLSRHIQQQISPRHALISPQLIQPLQSWLAKQNSYLQAPQMPTNETQEKLQDTAYTWLGLKLLIELKEFLSLPIPIPHSLLAEAATSLTPAEQTELNSVVDSLIQELKQAIHGKDAFLPAQTAVSPTLIDQITQAITTQTSLTIAYQALGDLKASHRQVQPLRLENRGNLYYLHAYCYRAETNLTFRLDRIKCLAVCNLK